MPAATTHVEFAKDVYRQIKDSIHIANKQMFYLGSQGPDMLFFSKASIFPGSLHKYGNLLHNKKIPEVIAFFEHYAQDDTDLQSYIQGYLCHYALDSTAHPLVFAESKVLHEEYGMPVGLTHVTLEAEIDVWLLGQRGRTIDSYNVYRYLKVKDSDRHKLATMYHNMFLQVFGLDISAERIDSGIKEVHTWTKFIRPTKNRYKSLYNFEKVLGNHFITAMMLCGKKPGKIINLEHLPYPLSWDSTQSISASFPELYGKAVYRAIALLIEHSSEDFTLDFNGKQI